MSKKHKAWIHVGMAGTGDVIELALAHHHQALVELGVASIAQAPAESFRAAVEITRSHKDWGLKRNDVEGQWTRLVRRAQKSKADLAFSQPLLATATPDQVALLIDALAGYQVHVVITTGLDDESAAITQWAAAVRKPERLHVIEADGMDSAELWKSFGKLAGFGTTSLSLAAVPQATSAVQSLPDALRELDKLSRRNASLEVRIEELDRKRRKLKRRLDRSFDDVA